MKNKYAALENEYRDTIRRLSALTGWPAEQAESIVGLVMEAAEKKALAVSQQKYQDVKNAKYLATKTILEKYRLLRASIESGTEHALWILKDTEYQRLMQAEESLQNQNIRSTALQAARNRVLWAQVNAALECFKRVCEQSTGPREKRGYELIYQRYLAPDVSTVEQLLCGTHLERSVFFDSQKTAIETLSVLLFGLDSAEDFMAGRSAWHMS